MTSKPKIIPIDTRYHLFRQWWSESEQWAVMCCGLVRQVRLPLQTLGSYADPDLCRKCLRLRPKAQRTLTKSKRRGR